SATRRVAILASTPVSPSTSRSRWPSSCVADRAASRTREHEAEWSRARTPDGATESTRQQRAREQRGGPVTRFEDLGPNSGLVEELYQRYLRNPASVDEHWRAYFSGATPPTGDGAAPVPPAPPAEAAPAATPAPAAPTSAPAPARPGPMVLDGDEPEPLRGAAARTVENMEASLG